MSARPSTVYFYSTCVVDLLAPQAGVDAIHLLQEAGIEVVFPQAQSCCGQPAYTSGFFDEARRVAQSQLAIFPERWPIVVPSGSCAGMMKHHWPSLFAADPALEARARDVADRIVEWSAFAQEPGHRRHQARRRRATIASAVAATTAAAAANHIVDEVPAGSTVAAPSWPGIIHGKT